MVQPVFAVGLERLGGNHRDALEVSTESGEERSRRLLHTNTQRIFVNDLDLLNLLIVRPYPRFDLWVEDAVDIPLGRLGIEVRAVVEFHTLLKVKNIRFAFV